LGTPALIGTIGLKVLIQVRPELDNSITVMTGVHHQWIARCSVLCPVFNHREVIIFLSFDGAAVSGGSTVVMLHFYYYALLLCPVPNHREVIIFLNKSLNFTTV
jgi:hypothetical protein